MEGILIGGLRLHLDEPRRAVEMWCRQGFRPYRVDVAVAQRRGLAHVVAMARIRAQEVNA